MDPGTNGRQRAPFLTFLYFLLGLGAVLLLVGGVGVYLFLRTPQGQKILTLAREGTAILAEAAMAPGTSELRDAGCETALAVPAGKLADLVRQLEPTAGGDALGQGFLSAGALDLGTTVVFCSQREPGTPDCSAAAKIYASAVAEAPERFAILMAPRPNALAGCSGIFAPDGTRIGELPEVPEADEAGSSQAEASTGEDPLSP